MVGIYTVKSGEIKTEDGESKRSQKSSHINKQIFAISAGKKW